MSDYTTLYNYRISFWVVLQSFASSARLPSYVFLFSVFHNDVLTFANKTYVRHLNCKKHHLQVPCLHEVSSFNDFDICLEHYMNAQPTNSGPSHLRSFDSPLPLNLLHAENNLQMIEVDVRRNSARLNAKTHKLNLQDLHNVSKCIINAEPRTHSVWII